MVNEPRDGRRYLCILHSMEDGSYGDDRPRKPWWGQLKIQNNPGGQAMMLRTVCDDGTLDDDSNASAFVKNEDLFESPDAADREYLKRLAAWALERLGQVQEALNELARSYAQHE